MYRFSTPPSILRDVVTCLRRVRYHFHASGFAEFPSYALIADALLSDEGFPLRRPDRIRGNLLIEFKPGDADKPGDMVQMLAYLCESDLDVGLIVYRKKNKFLFVFRHEDDCEVLKELDRLAQEIAALPEPPDVEPKRFCRYCSYREICSVGMYERVLAHRKIRQTPELRPHA